MSLDCDADRYVIIGNHYDAFVLGAVDPNSGTAVMLELSRAFAKLQSQGQLHAVASPEFWLRRGTVVFL